jgi:hypothetical protein
MKTSSSGLKSTVLTVLYYRSNKSFTVWAYSFAVTDGGEREVEAALVDKKRIKNQKRR